MNLYLRYVIGAMWYPPLLISGIYVVAELLIVEKKRLFILIYIIFGVVCEIFIFFDPWSSITYKNSGKAGENITDPTVKFSSPLFIFAVIYFLSFLIFFGFGFLQKAIRTTGLIRKKFLFIALGAFFIIGVGVNNSFAPPSIFNYFILIVGYILGFWLLYLGLKEETEEPKKKPPKKEVKVEESLFRIAQRPAHITEEEVSISKERKVCLVCKGKLAKLLYMCPDCNSFYCVNCSEALSNAENACWVCDAPFDDYRLSKPFKKEEKLDIEIEK